MSFTMDDVMQTLQIVKECKDAELHIDTGDIKLSIFKGDIDNNTRSPLNFSGAGCQANPVLAEEAPVAPPPPSSTMEAVEAPEPAPAAPVETKKEETAKEGLVTIKANMTSVFYRRSSPEEPPFVEVGDEVKEDTVVCLLEVMKCFRQVTADVAGVVAEICVESNHMVEEETVLFYIQPK
jgi:acetyl-CoA carboxylase biotin carboxyl carrier protein